MSVARNDISHNVSQHATNRYPVREDTLTNQESGLCTNFDAKQAHRVHTYPFLRTPTGNCGKSHVRYSVKSEPRVIIKSKCAYWMHHQTELVHRQLILWDERRPFTNLVRIHLCIQPSAHRTWLVLRLCKIISPDVRV